MRYKLFVIIFSIFTATSLVLTLPRAASADPFNQNDLIGDVAFDNVNTMTAAQIDTFLNSFPSSCISTNNGFSAIDPTGYNPTNGFLYGGNVSAGQVIYDAAQAYGINPQVLLTTLQKEQSLVDGSAGCSTLRYAAATGYGCPDGGTTYNYSGVNLYAINGVTVTSVSGTCVNTSLKVGFSQQVIRAAWLLKFGEQRSEGNINWAVIKGNWDNSDDPQTCYGGPMTQGTWQICPSGATTYYDGYTTIDGTSVHMDDGATAALYWYTPHFAGNQNFDTIFQNWFGSLIGSYLVRTVSNPTVYLLSGNNKYPIADINVLNDFSALGTVQFVSDSYLTPYTTGAILGHMVGASSGTLYFVDSGMKLPFPSCTLVTDYGYSCSSVITLTDFQLSKLATGPSVTSVYGTTTGRLFYISGGQKREAFDQQALANIGVTAPVNVLLDQGISYLPYGAPVTRNAVTVIDRDTGMHYLYDNGNFWTLNQDMYGLTTIKDLSHTSLDDASVPATQRKGTFTGFVSDSGNTNQYAVIDSGKVKLSVPTDWTPTYISASSDLLTAVPDDTTTQLNSELVKDASSPSVYYVTGAAKRPIPSWQDLVNLHITPFAINTIPDTVLNSITTGPVIYSSGQMVKTPDSPTVYVAKSHTELFPISSFTYPEELGLTMSLLPISDSDLGKYTVLPLLQTKITCNGTYYVGILGQLYSMTTTQLTQFGFNSADFVDATSVCLNAPVSTQALGSYIHVPNGTIYIVQNGEKQAFTSYSAYLAHGGTAQNTTNVSYYFASLIPSGANITQ